MKKQLLAVILSAALALACFAAASADSKYEIDGTVYRWEDMVNTDPENDANVYMNENSELHLFGNIISRFINPESLWGEYNYFADGETKGYISGDISTYFSGYSGDNYFSNAFLLDSDLQAEKLSLITEDSDMAYGTVLNLRTTESEAPHTVDVGDVSGSINGRKTVAAYGIDSLIDGNDVIQDITVQNCVDIAAGSEEGNVELTAVHLETPAYRTGNALSQINLTVNGDPNHILRGVSAVGRSNDGNAEVYGFLNDESDGTLSGNLSLRLADVYTEADAYNNANSTGISLFGNNNPGEGLLNAVLSGRIAAIARSTDGIAASCGLSAANAGVDIILNSSRNSLLSASANADNGSAYATALSWSSSGNIAGPWNLMASAKGLYADSIGVYAMEALRGDIGVGDIKTYALGTGNAKSKGVSLLDSTTKVKAGNVTAEAEETDEEGQALSNGIEVNDRADVTAEKISSSSKAKDEAGAYGVDADNGGRVKTGDIKAEAYADGEAFARSITANNGSHVTAGKIDVLSKSPRVATAHGVDADNGAKVEIGDIKTVADANVADALAVLADNGASVTAGNIEVASKDGWQAGAYGVDVDDGARVEVGDINSEASADTYAFAKGLTANRGSNVTAGKIRALSKLGKIVYVYGADVADKAHADIGDIKAEAYADERTAVDGIFANDNSFVTSGKIEAFSNSTGEAQTYGVEIDNEARVEAGDIKAEANADEEAESYGIKADNNSFVTSGKIESSSKSANSARAYGVDVDNGARAETGDVQAKANAYNAVATGIVANNGSFISAGDITALSDTLGARLLLNNMAGGLLMPMEASSTGALIMNGSSAETGNISASVNSLQMGRAVGADVFEGGKLKAKDILVSAAGGEPSATGVSVAGSGSSVTADNIHVLSDSTDEQPVGPRDSVGAEVRSGASLTAKEIYINRGTGLLIDNASRATLTDGLFADNMFEGGNAVFMPVSPVLPNDVGALNIGAIGVYKGNLLYLEGESGIADEDDLVAHLPSINLGKLLTVDPVVKLIDGEVDGKPISEGTKQKIMDKITMKPYRLFGWEDGEHYTIDYVDTSKLEKPVEGYDVYACGQDEDVDFHIRLDRGYGVTTIETGGYAAVEPKTDGDDGWYYVKIPIDGGVYITVKVHKTVYAALHNYYFYGMDPETKERTLWACTKVDHGKAKLICVNGFEETPDNFIEEYCSSEEREHILSDGYRLEPELSEKIFGDGLEHPIIEVDVFYIGY